MTRIGFAYNQKPAESRKDFEPPNTGDSEFARRTGEFRAISGVSTAPADDIYAEWDAPETIDAVEHALAQLGKVIRLEANEDFPARLRAAKPDIVFNIAEGLHGVNREAHVPAICEFFGIPYSGSDPYTLSLCLDKGKTKETLAFHGVPTAAFSVVRSVGDLDAIGRGQTRLPIPSEREPLFIKPIHEGSSKGITEANYITDAKQLLKTGERLLEQYAQPLLAETFLTGAEFTCGVLGNGKDAVVLPAVAINFAALPDRAIPIYGFEAKWIWDRPDNPLEIFECPAKIPDALRLQIEDVVLRAYQVLGCRDWSRIDVRLDANGVPNLVEVNPLPGILPDPADNSCLPKAARAAGLSYDELLQACLIHACERTGVQIGRKAASPVCYAEVLT